MVAYTTLLTLLTIASAQSALAAPTSPTSLKLRCTCGNDKLNTDITAKLCKEASQDDPEVASFVNGSCVFTGPIVETAEDSSAMVDNFMQGCAQVDPKCNDLKVEVSVFVFSLFY